MGIIAAHEAHGFAFKQIDCRKNVHALPSLQRAERAEDAKRKQLAKQAEKDISDTETEIAALQEEISRPEVAADYKLLGEKCARLDALNARLEKLYEEYEKLI